MNILQEIVNDIQKDLVLKKQIVPIDRLESSPLFERQTNSLRQRIVETEESSQNTNVDLPLSQTSILVFDWPMSHTAMHQQCGRNVSADQ